MSTLDTIFNSLNTDKGSRCGDRHNYAPVYEALFAPLRDADIKILEVGVHEGASLDSWHTYFSRAEIHGAEILASDFGGRFRDKPRVKIHHVDATDPLSIAEDGFQIIIDDADHGMGTCIKLMRSLWQKLNHGGFYIIEDLFVGTLPWGPKASPANESNHLDYEGYSSGVDRCYLPKHPQDLNFLNRHGLPLDIGKILQDNSHFFTITSISPTGGLHMMLVITKS